MIDRVMESDWMPLAASPLPAARRVLVFAPHPDDEVFGCGGVLRLLAEAGATIAVIVAADGALGGAASAADAGTLAAAQVANGSNASPRVFAPRRT